MNKSLSILRKKSNRNLRKIKSTGYKTRKSISQPNLIGNFNHLSTSYKVYLFNKLSPEIIVATSHVCEPDYDSEFLPDILSEEGNHIFLLVNNKYGIIVIINCLYVSILVGFIRIIFSREKGDGLYEKFTTIFKSNYTISRVFNIFIKLISLNKLSLLHQFGISTIFNLLNVFIASTVLNM
jgi:hypothetical protein